MNTKTFMAIAFATAAFTSNANAGIFDSSPKVYGAPALASAAVRTIDITASTKSVSVTNGETVTFNINGKQFTWKFDLYFQAGVVDLAFILPQEAHADGVKVYVGENPAFREMYYN